MINANIAPNSTLYSLAPAVAGRSTTYTGTGVDVSACKGSMVVILDSAAASAGDTLDVKIQESDSLGSGYTDVSGATFTQVTAGAASVAKISLNADALKKYIRAIGTIAGNGSESITFSVTALGWTA